MTVTLMEPLATLLREVKACNACSEHLPHGPRPVLQLHPSARILIAAQAPGRKVHESGVPFSDASGDRLRLWLDMTPEVFYDASKVAIVPMGLCFPGTGSTGDLPPRPECARLWRARLLSQLTQVRLTLVIGNYARPYHLPASGRNLTEAVQAWRSNWPHTVALPHPSPRNNRWLKNNPWFEADLLPELRPLVREALSR